MPIRADAGLRLVQQGVHRAVLCVVPRAASARAAIVGGDAPRAPPRRRALRRRVGRPAWSNEARVELAHSAWSWFIAPGAGSQRAARPPQVPARGTRALRTAAGSARRGVPASASPRVAELHRAWRTNAGRGPPRVARLRASARVPRRAVVPRGLGGRARLPRRQRRPRVRRRPAALADAALPRRAMRPAGLPVRLKDAYLQLHPTIN